MKNPESHDENDVWGEINEQEERKIN